VLPDGSLLAGDSTLEAIYRLQDLDGDGTFLGIGELSLYFQASEQFPLSDLDSLGVTVDGVVYAGDEDTGLVLALRDLDGDGSANSLGEATIFVDASVRPRVRDLNDLQVLPGGGLLLLDGSADTIFFAADGNGDGDALDEGEVVRLLLDDGKTLATPSGIAYREESVLPPPPPQEFVRGDANRDLVLDISDAITVLKFLFLGGVEDRCLDAMDSDDSGVLNISDPIWILNHLFLGSEPPRPPYPEPGPDPTEDELDCSADS
ncbi:MAG: hypothetical protein O7J95_13670, partial [Planctomycetota bacterium]|nr:hypothetical protein [Planctomycetota bacterium]